MKKISISAISALSVAEVIVLITLMKITAVSVYIWIPFAIVAILCCATVYTLLKKISESIDNENMLQKQNKQKYLAELTAFKDECVLAINDNNKMLEEKINNISSVQQTMIESNNSFCSKVSSAVVELKNENEEYTQKINNQMVSFIKKTDEVIKHQHDAFEKSIQAMNTGVNSSVKEIKEFCNAEIAEMNTVIARCISSFDSRSFELESASKEFLRETVNGMKEKLAEIILEIRTEFDAELKRVEEASQTYNNSCESTLRAISQKIVNVNNQNTEKLISDCRKITRESIETISIGTSESINSISAKYDEIMHEHIKVLNAQITERINEFVKANERSLADTIMSTNKLIETENSFIANINENNSMIQAIITDSYIECVSAINKSITDFENKLSQKIEESKEHNNNNNNELKAALECYAGSLVEKSAEAIANVQKDNNIKLQLLSDSLTDLSKKNQQFADYNNDFNNQTTENIKAIIAKQNEFVEKTSEQNQEISSYIQNAFNNCSSLIAETVASLETTLTDKIKESQNLHKINLSDFSNHNKHNFEELKIALEIYSDSLVEKSAEAIADVQKDNNTKLQELADSLGKLANENRLFTSDSRTAIKQTRENISQMIAHNNDMATAMGQIVDDNMSRQIKNMVENLSQQLDDVNKKNSEQFNKSMEDYRDEFVKVNAEAIQSVQSGYVEQILLTRGKVDKLTDSLSNTTQELSNTAQNFIDDLGRSLKKQHEKICNEIEDTLDAIKKVNTTIKSNTESYSNTLSLIQTSQKELNSLTSSDIKLLEKLIKK